MIKVYVFGCVDKAKEHPIGIECAERIIAPRADTENVAVSVAEPKDGYELSKLLNDAYFEMREFQSPAPPVVLHFDAHGNDRGISMPNGEVVTWKEIAGYCEQISTLNNIQVIVIMGACKGAHAMGMVSHCDRAPYYCLFGPGRDIHSIKLQDFYRDFYSTLMNKKEIIAVVREVMSRHKEDIYFATSLYLFESAYTNWFGPGMDDDHSRRRKKMSLKLKRLPLPNEEIKRRQALLERPELWEPQFFRQFRHRFLMIDLYPANEERFAAISFEAILQKARAGH